MSSERTHSPEPWTVKCSANGNAVVASNGGIVLEHQFGTHQPGDAELETMQANVERIVACVNAMQGINDPEEFIRHSTRSGCR